MRTYIYGLAILVFASSCEKKMDKIFDESPVDRLNTSVENSYTVLQSNKEGWLMEYFPSSALEFGGYTMFVKFPNSVDVSFEGDFTSAGMETSTYTVVAGAGPILTFDTYNRIFHYFALPQYFNKNSKYQLPGFISSTSGVGAANEGFKGENDFLVLKASSDSVVLEGRKSYNKATLTPLKAGEYNALLASYKAAVTKFFPLGGYKIEVGGETINTTFSNALTKRSLVVDGLRYGFRFIPTGLDFYKEYEIKGVKFKVLKYVDPTGTYNKGYFTNDAETIKFVPTT